MRVFTVDFGFGKVLEERDGMLFVRWDTNPWFPNWIGLNEVIVCE